MKPDKNVCLNCGKEISGKAKYCSDKCRMAYKRNPNKQGEQNLSEQPKTVNPNTEPEQDDLRASLTKTDKTFYDRAMRDFNEPYYYFNQQKPRETECGFCKTKFKTTLRLNRYCSYEHYQAALNKRSTDGTT